MKNGQQIGLENLETLRQYFDNMEKESQALPTSGGKPNYSAIALACGFNRQVLYQNPRCKALLLEMFGRFKGEEVAKVAKATSYDPRDKRIRELEKKLCDMQERLDHAERKLVELEPYKRLYELAQSNGRDL